MATKRPPKRSHAGSLREALNRIEDRSTRWFHRRGKKRWRAHTTDRHASPLSIGSGRPTEGETTERPTLPYVLYRRTKTTITLLAQNEYEAPLEVMAYESRLMAWNDGSTFHVVTIARWETLQREPKPSIRRRDGSGK